MRSRLLEGSEDQIALGEVEDQGLDCSISSGVSSRSLRLLNEENQWWGKKQGNEGRRFFLIIT